VSTLESTLHAPTPDVALPADETGLELKRGAVFNTIALLASNFRAIAWAGRTRSVLGSLGYN